MTVNAWKSMDTRPRALPISSVNGPFQLQACSLRETPVTAYVLNEAEAAAF